MKCHLQWFGHVTGRGNPVIQNIQLLKWNSVSGREDPGKAGARVLMKICKFVGSIKLMTLTDIDGGMLSTTQQRVSRCVWTFLTVSLFSYLTRGYCAYS